MRVVIADDVRRLVALRRHLGVVHHVPGRLRLRVGAALIGAGAASDRDAVAQWLESIDGIRGIRGIRINPLAASVVVEYDAARFPPHDWEILLSGPDDEAAALIARLMPSVP